MVMMVVVMQWEVLISRGWDGTVALEGFERHGSLGDFFIQAMMMVVVMTTGKLALCRDMFATLLTDDDGAGDP